MTVHQFALCLGIVSVLGGCAPPPAHGVAQKDPMKQLVFLTSDGCVNTVTMRANLDEALKGLGLPATYQFIDADTLAPSDPRGGYGTPTVLHEDRDLFGMDEPTVPHPAST
ncbi:MAG: hypothetical protein Q8O42_12405 [Acidobacteriota bacterium]|nr:hypothetical protein [Acidobacteriota bacterium]